MKSRTIVPISHGSYWVCVNNDVPRSILILRDALVLGLTAMTTLLFLSAPIIAIIIWFQIARLISP